MTTFADQSQPRFFSQGSLIHAVVATFAAFFVITGICLCAHDAIVKNQISEEKAHRCQPYYGVASFLWFYVASLLVIRLPSLGAVRLAYEMLWMCNVSMVLAAIGLQTNRPLLVSAAACAVSIDQVMWWVDVGGWLLSGSWPIGVAKYLSWPETSWGRRVTSTHHLWFLPLCVCTVGFPVAVRRDELAGSLVWAFATDYSLSLVAIAVTSVVTRLVTPFKLYPKSISSTVVSNSGEGKGCTADHEVGEHTETLRRRKAEKKLDPLSTSNRPGGGASREEDALGVVELNINLCYEVWRDVGDRFPMICVAHPDPKIHLPRLLAIWAALNLPCALVLLVGSKLVPNGK